MNKHLLTYLKGMAMGAAEIVPGVSGGTIALITGIYEELIGSLSAFDLKSVQLLFKGQLAALWERIHGTFLLTLFLGMLTSIFSLASAFAYALEFFEIQLWSFFFGLVLASAFLVIATLKVVKPHHALWVVAGAVIAYGLTSLPASAGADQWYYIMASGAIAICAMILPGISGSFILLLLGAYSIVLGAVNDLELAIILYFGIGAVLGLLTFTKLLKWVFAHYHDSTIALLSGFLLGSLNKLWPWKNVLETFTKHPGTEKEEIIPLVVEKVAPDHLWPQALAFALLGAAIVLGLHFAGRKKEAHNAA